MFGRRRLRVGESDNYRIALVYPSAVVAGTIRRRRAQSDGWFSRFVHTQVHVSRCQVPVELERDAHQQVRTVCPQLEKANQFV